MFKQIEILVYPAVFKDVLIDELGKIGFDSFWETDNGIKAFIDHSIFKPLELDEVLAQVSNFCQTSIVGIEDLKQQNWNEPWEAQFEAVAVGNDLIIKAPFHIVEGNFKHQLLIQPKMSFGTGHHATTFLVAQKMLTLDFTGKKVLDFGSGTAILSILAEKLGASYTLAIDNDEWSYDNAQENAALNDCTKIDIKLGSSEFFETQKFDCVIANINRTVILSCMHKMAKALLPNASLLISGILSEDIPLVMEKANNCGLQLMEQNQKDNWMMLYLEQKQ